MNNVLREIASSVTRLLWLLRRVNIERVRRHGRIYLERAGKWLQRRFTRHPARRNFPIFIAGSNRSGTQMVCRALGNHRNGWDYPESNHSIAFDGYYLRSSWLIRFLISAAPAPAVSFGSILDSQVIDRLLSQYKDARAIWVYRCYEDAANSCVKSFGGQHRQLMRWVAAGTPEKLGPRGAHVSREMVDLIAAHFREDLTNEDCACLYWYMRNQIYFDLGLDRDPRVLLVQYEDAVLNKTRAFQRITDFLGLPYDPDMTKDVLATSVNKHPWPSNDPAVKGLCDGLKARLDNLFFERPAAADPIGDHDDSTHQSGERRLMADEAAG